MAIETEMYRMIETEIEKIISEGGEKRKVDLEKAKEVAKMLTNLSTDESADATNLVNQYIANIKQICD